MVDVDLDQPPEQWQAVGEALASGVAKHVSVDALGDILAGAFAKGILAIAKTLAVVATPVAKLGGEALVELEEPILPVFAAFIAPIIGSMFNTAADPSLFANRGNREGRADAARALVEAYMTALAGGESGEVSPSDEGAKRVASAGVHAAIEGWFNSWILEMLGEAIPWDWLHFKEMTAFPEEVIEALGISNMTQRALRPLVDATARTPMRWATNKKYRPTMLGEADIIKAFLRGDYGGAEAAEQLARLGYSDERQTLLLKGAQKYLSASDALVLLRNGVIDRGLAIAHLRAQGYDQVGAEQAFVVEETRRLEAIHDDSVSAIKAAYVDRRIDDAELSTLLSAVYASDVEQVAHEVAFRTMRDMNTKRLSPSQAEACVRAKVLSIADYRAALEREGYLPDDVIALELLLETELNADADVEQLRKQKADAAALARQQRDEDAAKKLLEAEHQAALKRRGSPAALKNAVVIGLIPVSRYAEVLAPELDADTVQILVDQAQADRDAYLAQQKRADDAAKRAALKHVDVGAYKTAVLEGILTLEQFRQALEGSTVDPADVTVLVAVLRKQKADRDAAERLRADAAAKAKIKHVDIASFEQLVRRGHRSIGQYGALLGELGYDEAARAALLDLLQVAIADDAHAEALRKAAAAAKDVKGLSLEQIRRAVILGNQTVDDFQRWLVQNKYTADAQAVLVAELRAALAEAEAARKRRAAGDAGTGAAVLALSTIERAARLGVVPPAAYEARLRAAGYSDDDIAIDLDLLAVEIADVQAQRARAAAAEARANDPGLTLQQLATAVQLGEASLDDYRARAVELHYVADDVAVLAAVLDDDVQTAQAAQARHDAIATQLQVKNLSLSELDKGVLAGLLALDDYRARVRSYGYDDADTALLVELLQLQLAAAAAKATG